MNVNPKIADRDWDVVLSTVHPKKREVVRQFLEATPAEVLSARYGRGETEMLDGHKVVLQNRSLAADVVNTYRAFVDRYTNQRVFRRTELRANIALGIAGASALFTLGNILY